MIAWTIKGEAGKTFDATVRSLEAAQIDSAQIAFKSLAEDTFTFTISPQSVASAIIPELKQSIILYRAGVMFFHGTVTNVRNAINSESQQVQVTVSGPWWWMERIGFTTNLQDGMGNVSERLSAVFGSASAGQDLGTSIDSVINRCAALGVPIATTSAGSGTNAMTTFPRITLNQSTCGQVLSELVRLVPDTVVWFDYSVIPARIYVVRRDQSVNAITFNAATDPITSIDINPIIELQVSNVSLPYVTRSGTGLTQFVKQEAGSGSSETRQVLTISGPELDTFLPNDLFDNVLIKTSTLSDAIGYSMASGFISKYGYNPVNTSGTTFTSVNYWANGNGLTINTYQILASSSNVAGYTPVLFGSDRKGNPPEWMIKQAGLIQTQVTGGIWMQDPVENTDWTKRIALNTAFGVGDIYKYDGTYYNTGRNFEDNGPTIWLAPNAVVTAYTVRNPGLNIYGSPGTTNTSTRVQYNVGGSPPYFNDGYVGQKIWIPAYKKNNPVFWASVTVSAYDPATKTFTHSALPSGYRAACNGDSPANYISLPDPIYYRSADYSFISPPAGLATFLQAAQSWLPYEGSINLVQEDVGGTRYRGTKISIINSVPAFASMGALVESETLDIKTGSTTINLGCPPRNDYRTIVDKIRKTSQDNIVYI